MVRVMARVEFFYDYSSPWTYLAFTRIEELCRRHDAELVWRPILVGGIFNTVNPSVYEARQHPVRPRRDTRPRTSTTGPGSTISS
jgi:2-hydroxychromene-2-carboxylate isomerase